MTNEIMKKSSENKLELYKKGLNKNEQFLSETCQYFLEKELIDKISEKFLKGNIPNFDRVGYKIKNICKLEANTLYIPFDELTDIINFSIMVEKNQEIKQFNENKTFKINSFSDVLKNGIEEEIKESNDFSFESEDIKEFIFETSKNYTSDLEIKNENIIITFS